MTGKQAAIFLILLAVAVSTATIRTAYAIVISPNDLGTVPHSDMTVNPGDTLVINPNTIASFQNFNNNGGNVFVQGQLYIYGNFTNSGIIIVTQNAHLVVEGQIVNQQNGLIKSDSGSAVEFHNKVSNHGRFDNYGYLGGQSMNLTTTGTLNNYGSIESLGITVRALDGGTYNNYGKYHGTDYSFLINQNATINNYGSIANGAGDVINNGVLNNNGTLSIHQQTYGVSTLQNQAQGTINNSANLVIECGANFTNNGTLTGSPITQIACPTPLPPPAQPIGCPDPTQECPSPP